MSNVRLRVDKFLEGETLENGALVEIRALEPSGRSRLIEKVPVPVGDNPDRYRSLDLAPGLYELTAHMPSGELLSETVDLPEQSGSTDVVLKGIQSWQHPGTTESAVLKGLGSYATYGSDSSPELAAELWLVPQASIDPVWQRLDPWLAQLAPGKPLKPGQIFPPEVQPHDVPLRRDPPYAFARLERGVQFGGRRSYLVVRHGPEAILCAMPYPWQQSDGSGEALVEATIAIDEEGIGSSSIEEPGWSVRTGVRDRRVGSILSYFSSGDAVSARELIRPARELLFEKGQNPIAAAGGGYVLVDEWVRDSSRSGGTDTRWTYWIDNLSHWFPWLPDGTILEGWLALRRRDKPPDLAKARGALLEAERRGIPFYTAGVRRLSDGLMLLANEARRNGSPDPEIDGAVARVRRLAWQVDPRQTFTCVRLFPS